MAMLVHLAPHSAIARIRRNGIKAAQATLELPGVYAMPVLPNFYVSHQWLREIRRWKSGRTLVAVDFRLPDDEPVHVGHYAAPHARMPAAEAVAVIMHAEDPLGYEILVPRSILADEVHRFRGVPQVTGWRYWPKSHGTKPCGCPVCQFGSFGAASTGSAP